MAVKKELTIAFIHSFHDVFNSCQHAHSRTAVRVSRRIKSWMYNWKNPTYVHVKNPLRALYKNYLLFTILFKVRIIELFWLVNFGNIIQSAFLAYFKWDDMIYRSSNSIGSLFFNCPIGRTVTVKTRNIYKKQYGARPCVAFSLYPQMKS